MCEMRKNSERFSEDISRPNSTEKKKRLHIFKENMGLCGSNVNIAEISNDAEDDVDTPPEGWTVATLEQKIIELSDKLSTSTNKALSLKRAKKIKEAKRN